MSYECVPLYDTLGENAVEFIINHSEAVVVFADSKKLGSLAKALKGIDTAVFKHVVFWGDGDKAAAEVGRSACVRFGWWCVFCPVAAVMATHVTCVHPAGKVG